MTPPPGDEELMNAYLSGDARAFEELYRRHSGKVYSYLMKRSGEQRETADELLQVVFLKFHQSRTHYDARYPVLQWLYVISKTTLLDHFRKQGRRVPEVNDLSPEEVEKQKLPPSQTPEVPSLDSLEGEHRKIVEWRFLDDASYEEIATRVGKSQQSVRQIVSRSLKKLRGVKV